MDGILEELLRLEDAKHHALLNADEVAYDDYVCEQIRLLDDPQISTESRWSPSKLLEFSKRVNVNASLYWNQESDHRRGK